jgi:quercetin dioxygenase-like cupin family protein
MPPWVERGSEEVPLINLEELCQFDTERPLSLLVHDSDKARVALFCLKAGQEVPPHTTSSEVVLFVVRGRGRAVVGEEEPEVERNSLVVCPPEAPHGFKAEEDMVVLAVIAPRP